jgi:hypothetical protein
VVARALTAMVDAAHGQLEEIAREAAAQSLRMCALDATRDEMRDTQVRAARLAVGVATDAVFPPLSERLVDALLPKIDEFQSKCWLQVRGGVRMGGAGRGVGCGRIKPLVGSVL